MKLGTSVKPMGGPHDLDFVCEFAVSHRLINPLVLLDEMYNVFVEHGVYGGMVERKNRCVRIIYKDEFWLDILPSCKDHANGGDCIQVPDRDLGRWSPSNPTGYAKWFENAGRGILARMDESVRYLRAKMMDSIQPIPALQTTREKTVLQLIVQLLKRWRDVHYNDSNFPPISVVLTTLAADLYDGEESISLGLLKVLDGIVTRLDAAHALDRRLRVPNPVHLEEDFSERWKSSPRAYLEFNDGIRNFATTWREICVSQGNLNRKLEDLFGSVIDETLVRQARSLHAARVDNKLGILQSGVIVPVAYAVTPMARNTNHGQT